MGRHSDGKPNYRVATGPLILVLVAILVGAAAVGWWMLRDSTEEGRLAGGECSKGDLTMYVAADPAVVGEVEDLATRYAGTNPVVRDHCVRPTVVDMGSRQVVDAVAGAEDAGEPGGAMLPAVWVPADDSYVDELADSTAVRVADERARLEPQPVGVAVPADRAEELSDASWGDLRDLTVATPGGMDSAASTLVNVELEGGTVESGATEDGPAENGADAGALRAAAAPRLDVGGATTAGEMIIAMTHAGEDGGTDSGAVLPEGVDGVAATGSMVDRNDSGLGFISPEGSAALSAPVVAFASGGAIEENAARAAADFVGWAGDNGASADAPDASPFEGPAAELLADAEARESGRFVPNPDAGGAEDGADGEEPADRSDPRDDDAAPAEGPGSALVLVDTSESMDLPAVTGPLTPLLAEASEGEGQRVAVWNYSSPQTPGVTNPVRANVFFGPGSLGASQDVLGSLGTVGEPWLWRSIGPAHEYALDEYREGMPNRIVLVTSGSDASGDDPAPVIEAIRAANEAAGEGRGVRIDIVVVGEDATDGALRDLADATGGSLNIAAADDDAAIDAALARALGL